MPKINYRKIWEEHYGPIPVDEEGRTYEIHHIDGDRSNNSIENLQCVSIQEHYNIHNKQKDYPACILILQKLQMTPQEISNLSREYCMKQIEEGKHPLVGSNNPRAKQMKFIHRDTKEILDIAPGKLTKICNEMGLSKDSMSCVWLEKKTHHKGWHKCSDNQNNTKFYPHSPRWKEMKFIHAETKEILIVKPGMLKSICEDRKLNNNTMGGVWRGTSRQHKGWHRYDENVKTEFHRNIRSDMKFVHKETKEILIIPYGELSNIAKKNGLNRCCLSFVYNGRMKEHKGWKKYG